MGPSLERLAKTKRNFRIVIVDIDKWGSPVASQHNIRSLPSLWLYDGTELKSKDSRKVWAFIHK